MIRLGLREPGDLSHELTKVGARVPALDPPRDDRRAGPVASTRMWLVPAGACARGVILLAMLAAPGVGAANVSDQPRVEDLADRLNALGATIEVFRDI